MPFKVKLGSGVVEVLGTRFNIMAYQNEAKVRTTLLQGAVKVTHNGHRARLAQARRPARGPPAAAVSPLVRQIRMKAVSWKEGYFQFNRRR